MLVEKYITTFQKDEKEKYFHEVIQLIDKTYAPIGGAKNLDSYDELLDDKYFWKLVRKNSKIVAVQIYKDVNGSRKAVLAGTDGTDVGKQALYALLSEDIKLKDRGAFIEISGPKMEHIHIDKLGNTPIQPEVAIRILNALGKDGKVLSNKEKLTLDSNYKDYYYKRIINGQLLYKTMVGNIDKLLQTM